MALNTSASPNRRNRRGSPSASVIAKLMSSPIFRLLSCAALQRMSQVSSVRTMREGRIACSIAVIVVLINVGVIVKSIFFHWVDWS